MLIAIPSKGRAHRCPSWDYIPSATMFVPANELTYYQAVANGRTVVPIPDDVTGITRTRNWILDYATDEKTERVVFIDDDVKLAGWIELGKFSSKHHRLDGDDWLAIWPRLFDLTEDVGYHIWGIQTGGSLREVYPYFPIRSRSHVTASCMGILNRDGLRFDETFRVKEDYELCLRCIKNDGGIISWQAAYWVNEHWTTDGGLKDSRSVEQELETIARLQRMYPGIIRRIRRKGSDVSILLDF